MGNHSKSLEIKPVEFFTIWCLLIIWIVSDSTLCQLWKGFRMFLTNLQELFWAFYTADYLYKQPNIKCLHMSHKGYTWHFYTSNFSLLCMFLLQHIISVHWKLWKSSTIQVHTSICTLFTVCSHALQNACPCMLVIKIKATAVYHT